MITRANALKIRNWPMIGCTSWIGASAAPASPHIGGRQHDGVARDLTGFHADHQRGSRFWAIARMARPNGVRVSSR